MITKGSMELLVKMIASVMDEKLAPDQALPS